MPVTKLYTILDQANNPEEVFHSTTEFAKHLGITVGRLTKKLNGKTTLTYQEYSDLKDWLYKPVDYSMCGRNRKKGVQNK